MSINGIRGSCSTTGIDPARLEPKGPVTIDGTDPAPAGPGQARDQFRSDLKALFAAVKSGDITAAQDALTALQSDRAAMGDHGRHAGYAKSPVRREFVALIEAVQSGDTSAAQNALTRLQQDLFARGRTHSDRPTSPLPVDPGVPAPAGEGDSR